jgi:hypothetical protein
MYVKKIQGKIRWGKILVVVIPRILKVKMRGKKVDLVSGAARRFSRFSSCYGKKV